MRCTLQLQDFRRVIYFAVGILGLLALARTPIIHHQDQDIFQAAGSHIQTREGNATAKIQDQPTDEDIVIENYLGQRRRAVPVASASGSSSAWGVLDSDEAEGLQRAVSSSKPSERCAAVRKSRPTVEGLPVVLAHFVSK
ncbi:hypothetical protein CYMTET_53075, partial [Cymbomonas tetramitiformis]